MAQKLVDLAVSVLREAVTTYRHTDNNIRDGPSENGSAAGEEEVVIIDGTSAERTSDDEMSVQLFYTTRNMFEMFASLVPVYHRQLLTTLPQLAGNNYIFNRKSYIKFTQEVSKITLDAD